MRRSRPGEVGKGRPRLREAGRPGGREACRAAGQSGAGAGRGREGSGHHAGRQAQFGSGLSFWEQRKVTAALDLGADTMGSGLSQDPLAAGKGGGAGAGRS